MSQILFCFIDVFFSCLWTQKEPKETLLGHIYTFFFQYSQSHFNVICVLGLMFLKKGRSIGDICVLSVPEEDRLRVIHDEAWNCMFHLQAEVRRMNPNGKDD